jgi:hypothetical protein
MEGNGQTGASVEELVAARLDQSWPGGRAADLVLASLLGDDAARRARDRPGRRHGRVGWCAAGR